MTNAAKKKNTAATKDRGLSYKDVQIVFLTDGLGKVEKLLNGGLISKQSLRRAAKEFANNKSAQAFVDFAASKLGKGGEGRGRKLPEQGDTRTYKAQQVGKSGLFIRLPVSSIAHTKGEALHVSFGPGRILVSSKAG